MAPCYPAVDGLLVKIALAFHSWEAVTIGSIYCKNCYLEIIAAILSTNIKLMKNIIHTIRVTLALIFCALLVFGGRTFADEYDVNAVVPYDPPTQASVIEQPKAGELHQAQQTISGTCQQAAPYPDFVVSIWRSGFSLGSGVCDQGRFSVPVVLREGQNTLIARTITITGDYGPDSDPLLLTLTPPIVAQPLPPSVQQPTSETEKDNAINQGGLTGLVVATEKPFGLMNQDNLATIAVVVSGGQRPYTLQLNWGDGTIESYSLTSPGTYTYSHRFQFKRTYAVLVHVRDSLGAYIEYQYSVVSNTGQGTSGGGTTNKNTKPSSRWWANPWYVIVLVLILFVLLTVYWLGWHRAERRYQRYIDRMGSKKSPRAIKTRNRTVPVAKKRRKQQKKA